MKLPDGYYWVAEKFEERFRRSLVRVEDEFGYSMDGDVYDFSDSGMELAKSKGAEYHISKVEIPEPHWETE